MGTGSSLRQWDVQGIFWKCLEVLVCFSYQMWTSRQASAVLGSWPMVMKEILLRKSDPQESEFREGNYPVLEDISEPLSQPILKACFPVLSIPGQATASVYVQSSPQSVMGYYLSFLAPCLRHLWASALTQKVSPCTLSCEWQQEAIC